MQWRCHWRSGSVDLIFSSLMLQWCEQPQRAFAEIARVLRPEGLLLFSTLGPQTLDELRGAWRSVDAGPHVSEFIDLPQLSMLLAGAGLAEPVLDTDQLVRHYPDALALMRELKGWRTQCASDRQRGLFRRTALRAVEGADETCERPPAFQRPSKSFTAPRLAPCPSERSSEQETLIPPQCDPSTPRGIAVSSTGIFVAGTDTGVGKTRVSGGLLRALRTQRLPGRRHETGSRRCNLLMGA